MLLAEVAIGLHGKGAAIGMAQPPRDGRNIDARLDATGGEKVPEIVVIHWLYAYLPAG